MSVGFAVWKTSSVNLSCIRRLIATSTETGITWKREVPCWEQIFYHSFALGIPDGNSRVATLLERCSKWHDGIPEDGTREH